MTKTLKHALVSPPTTLSAMAAVPLYVHVARFYPLYIILVLHGFGARLLYIQYIIQYYQPHQPSCCI